MLVKWLGFLTQSVAVSAKVTLCHELSKFYAEEDERLTAVRAVLEHRLDIKLPRLEIDCPTKPERHRTTDGTAYCNENVNSGPPFSLASFTRPPTVTSLSTA